MPRKRPPPKEWEYVAVRQSGVHGRGLFAAVDLPRGSHIMEYRGEKVGKREGRRRTQEQWAEGRMYMFDLNKRYDIDGAPDWNLARLANYSCASNAESRNEDGKRIWIVAVRDIKAGDEITYDYNFDFVDPPPVCKCGAATCRGYIVGKAQIPKLRRWLVRHGLAIPVGARPKSAARNGAAKTFAPPKRSAKRSTKTASKRAIPGGGKPSRGSPAKRP